MKSQASYNQQSIHDPITAVGAENKADNGNMVYGCSRASTGAETGKGQET